MTKGYFRAAWNDIKNSPNWFGKLCLLALVWMIPVFGFMVERGYLYGWARQIAWNQQRPLPAHLFGNEDGALYRRGWFSLVIEVVMAVIPCLLYLAAYATNGWSAEDWGPLSLVLLVLYALAGIVFSMAAWVGNMRMTLYDNLGAGLQFKQIVTMMDHDFLGLLRIFVMQLIAGLVVSVIITALFFVVLTIGFVSVFAVGDVFDAGSGELIEMLGLIVALLPLFLVVCYAALLGAVFVEALGIRAIGYWTRNFRVDQWGAKDAPLPFERQSAPGESSVQQEGRQ